MSKKRENRPPQGGAPMGRGAADKPKSIKKGFAKLLGCLKPYKLRVSLVLVLAVLVALFSIFGPKILALATDELAAGVANMMMGAESGINFGYIAKILLLLVALYLISALCNFAQGAIMANVATKVSYSLRERIMKKINHLPLSYYNKHSTGDILSRITNDVDNIEESLSSSLTQIVSSITTFIGTLVMMLTISGRMTLIALATLPVSLAIVLLIVGRSQKYFVRQQQYLGRVNGKVEECYGGHTVIKAFRREEQMQREFDEENRTLSKSAQKAGFLSGLMQPLMGFVGNVGYVAVCILGATYAARGIVSIGDIQAFMQYVRNFSQPITQLANISSQLQRMSAASERVFEFLEAEEERDENVTRRISDEPVRGEITFDHVRFAYEDTTEPVIHDFSAVAKPGTKVAIVGPTGAGKTTMVKLVMRFHELSGGRILLDGKDITDYDRHDLRTEFGMVLQDTWLFSGTVMENIRYGREDASDEEVYAAARQAQVDHFIRTLPDGYNTVLDEDSSNVSQGQKQLLTIARAILADPRVLILDEATSSVDTRTEILIQRAMDELMKGRTSFIIAHRLSTIRNADLILCMRDGDIVEQGTHDELMAKNGFYAELYNSQFERAS